MRARAQQQRHVVDVAWSRLACYLGNSIFGAGATICKLRARALPLDAIVAADSQAYLVPQRAARFCAMSCLAS